jgi:3-phenylpropionate/trans-cinnamate dioxygenase ferredoxin reductase subunit
VSETFVVVGGGLAAAKAVIGLREAGFDGEVVLYGAEQHLPYERPPLSKGVLLGEEPLEKSTVRPREWYDDHHVDLRLGQRVTSLDPARHRVATAIGEQAYDRLLLATGSRPRTLPLDHGDAPVVSLRDREDSATIRDAFGEGRRIVLVGGGWIGLEVAAAARSAGCEVTVLEALDLPLVRVLGPEVAAVFTDLHRRHDVDVRTGAQVAGIHSIDDAEGRVGVVELADGAQLRADLVVVGIGAAPNVELAAQAGLDVDDGVLVDAHLATSDPDVFAAGDIAAAHHPVLRRRIRVEHWDTAGAQGELAAHNLMGEQLTYDRLPYFFTDQYDLGMEYVGATLDGYDEVVLRGDTDGLDFSAWWLKDGRVAAAMHVNQWDAIDDLRRLVGRPVGATELRRPDRSLGDIGTST